jgi:hypothetical protein
MRCIKTIALEINLRQFLEAALRVRYGAPSMWWSLRSSSIAARLDVQQPSRQPPDPAALYHHNHHSDMEK